MMPHQLGGLLLIESNGLVRFRGGHQSPLLQVFYRKDTVFDLHQLTGGIQALRSNHLRQEEHEHTGYGQRYKQFPCHDSPSSEWNGEHSICFERSVAAWCWKMMGHSTYFAPSSRWEM